jgi:hypothetical protein
MMISINANSAAGVGLGEIVIVPVTGFSDATPVVAVGGNYHTTVGEQRLAIFERAAFIWSNLLDLNYDIKVTAKFEALTCSSGSALLGLGGPDRVKKINDVWYPTALANQLLQADASGSYDDMHMTFNSSIDNGCYNGSPDGWYYGLDGNNPSGKQDLLSVAIHELAHGLGFLSFIGDNGVLFNSAIDAYSKNLKDYTSGKNWTAMTDSERAASAKNNLLFWDGTYGNAFAGTVLSDHAGFVGGEVRMFSPLSYISGSSVSHVATLISPNQLMEPYATPEARVPSIETAMFKDIGYNIKAENSSQNLPTITDYTLNVVTNGSIALDTMNNVSDLDGDSVSFYTFTQLPSNGSLSDLFNPGATYTPNANFTGTDTVKLKVYDSHFNLSAEGTVTINVGPVANVAPVATNDAYTINEDATATLFNVLSNDTDDVSLDTSSISIISGASNGTSNVSSGQIQYTPTANFNGSDTITYTVDDGAGDTSNTATITVTVTSIDDVPVVANNSYSLVSNSLNNNLNIIANDSDIDTTLNYGHVTIVSGVSHGSLNLSGSSLLYTPTTSYSGNDAFTYKLNDGTTDSTTATVSLSIVAPNVTPVTNNDSVTTPENVSVVIDFKSNDTDDKVISSSDYVIDSAPSNGSIAEISSYMQYDPNTNFSGVDTFTYHLVDDDGAVSNTSTVTVTVTHTNVKPTVVNDSAGTPEDTAVTFDVLSNDSDPEGDSLTYANVSIVSQPPQGTATIKSGGIEYTPNANFSGLDTMTYTVSDGSLTSSVATVHIMVAAVHDPSTLSNGSATVAEDGTVTLTISDLVTVGDSLVAANAYTIVTQPNDGTLSGLVYTPDADFNGSDSFTFKVTDANSADSNVATFTINVSAVHDAPVAVNSTVNLNEDESGTLINLTQHVTAGDAAVVVGSHVIVAQPSNGNLTGSSGSTMEYTPNADFNGTDSFTFTMSDATSATSNVSTITLNVASVNDAPVLVDGTINLDEDDSALTFNLADYISANDATVLASGYTITIDSSHGNVETVNASDSLTYTPNANFHGTDSISFKFSDVLSAESNVAVLTFNVQSVNDVPVANDDTVTVARVSTPVYVMDNDSDVDEVMSNMTIVIVSQTVNGVLSVSNADISYLVDSGSVATTDSFSYYITDSDGGSSSTAQVDINIENAQPPVANIDSYTVSEDSVNTSLNVANNDTGDLSIQTVSINNQAPNGSVTVDGLNILYTPNADYFGADSFSYRVTDTLGLVSNNATVTLNVTPVNDAPVAVADDISVTHGNVKSFNPLTNDTDDSASMTINIVTSPTHGNAVVEGDLIKYTPDSDFGFTADSLTYNVTDTEGLTSSNAVVTMAITYNVSSPTTSTDSYTTTVGETIELNVLLNDTFNTTDATVTIIDDVTIGTLHNNVSSLEYETSIAGTTSFTYTLTDEIGQVSNTSIVNITIGNVASTLVNAVDDFVSVNEDVAKVFNVLSNDTVANLESMVVSSEPSLGVVTIAGNMNMTYTPFENTEGTDSFTYTILDDQGDDSTASVFVTIVGDNSDLVTVDDNFNLTEDTTATVDVMFNDSLELEDNFEIVIKVQPVNGSAVINDNSTITYVPDTNFNGENTLIYSVMNVDSQVESNASIVTFNVDAVNDAPVSNADTYNMVSGENLVLDILNNDTDVDSNVSELKFVLTSTPSDGDVVIENNTITYSARANWTGVVTIQYYVFDEDNAQSEQAFVTINVSEPDLTSNPNNTVDTSGGGSSGGGSLGFLIIPLLLIGLIRRRRSIT